MAKAGLGKWLAKEGNKLSRGAGEAAEAALEGGKEVAKDLGKKATKSIKKDPLKSVGKAAAGGAVAAGGVAAALDGDSDDKPKGKKKRPYCD